MSRTVLIALPLPLLLSACQIMFDGGRPNIIPRPEATERMGERPCTSDDAASYVEALGPKWGTMNLPYGDSTVVENTDGRLILASHNNKLESSATSYDSYFRANGWERIGHHSEGNPRALRFSQHGHEMGVLVTWTAPDDLKIVIEDFAAVSESQVLGAFGPAAHAPAAGH